MGRIAVCGECLVDLIPEGDGGYRARAGGSPANTAVALARLGGAPLLLARISGDELGQLLRRHLVDAGVDLSRAISAAEHTGVAVVTRAADGLATYRFALAGAADWQWTRAELGSLPEDVVAVHAGSLALATAPGGAALEQLLARERPRRTVSIDPNLRPGLTCVGQASEGMTRWLGLADVVKASTEDVDLLHPGADPLAVARDWATRGPALVVITAGADGAFAVLGTEVVRVASPAVEVLDTVGAGDTFSAALLHALDRRGHLGGRLERLDTDDLRAALDDAVRAAAITCSRAGADPPWADELP